MGGVIQTVFGGSSNKSNSTQSSNSTSTSSSESGNHAYDYLKEALSGNVAQGNTAFSQIGSLLGLGGDKAGADAGYQNFLNSSGYQNIFKQAMDGVTGSAAAKGMLSSGATLKALQSRGADLAQGSFQNYLGNLQNVFAGGQQSASTIGGAGGYSNSNSSSNSTSTGVSNSKGSSSNGIFNSIFG